MPKPSLRENLLQAGLDVMFRSGYGHSGVREIAAAAGAPQGSFTNHFPSKEMFAAEVVDRYFEYVQGIMESTLADRSVSPRERIRRYLDVITEKLGSAGWERGCLIGNLSLEITPHSERLREQLSRIFAAWREPFAACIAEAQASGEIDSEIPAGDLADVLLAGWHGAMLRMKVDRDPKPLEQFKRVAFATYLGRRKA